jgi:hypothetical protein
MANYENAVQEVAPLSAENTGLGNLPSWPMNVNVKGASKSGGLDVTKANPNYLMDKETENTVLQNMQNLADKINSPMRIFNEGMKDVQAWTQYNKSPAFSQREEAAGKDRKDLYDIAQQQAAIRASQQQAQADAEHIARVKQRAMGSGSGTGGPSMAQQQLLSALNNARSNDVGTQIGLINKYGEQQIKSSGEAEYNPTSLDVKDVLVFNPANGKDELRQVNMFQYQDLLKKGYIRNPSEMYEPISGKTETRPTAVSLKSTPVSLDLVSADPTLRRIAAGESGLQNTPNLGGNSNAFGLYQIVPKTFDLVKSKYPELKDVTWEQFKADPAIQTSVAEKLHFENDKMLDQRKVDKTDLNRYTTWFSGDTKLATAPLDTPVEKVMSAQEIAANKLSGKTVGDVRNMLQGNLDRGDKILSSSKTATDLSKAKAELRNDLENPSPGVQVASTNKTGLPDIYKMKAEQEAYKEKIKTAAQESAKTAEIDRKDFKINTNPDTLIETDAMAKRVQKLVKEFPEISGVINKADYTSAVAGVLEEGIGPLSVKGLQTAIFKTLPDTGKDSLAARNELAQYLARMELQAAKLIKGQGQITEGEREILRRASASLDDPAELLYKKARIIERATRKNEQLAAIYGAGEKFADFEKFSQDPEFKQIMKEYRADLNNIMGEKVDFRKLKPGATSPKVQHPSDIQDILNRNKAKKAE